MSIRLLMALCMSLFAFQLQADSTRTQTGYYYPVGTNILFVIVNSITSQSSRCCLLLV